MDIAVPQTFKQKRRLIVSAGMGMLILDASRSLDYPLMQGLFLMLSLLTVGGNLLADLVYSWVDPRVRLARS